MTNENNDMTIQASTNGRRLTLDPLRTKTLQIEAREVKSTVPCGFRQEWVDGEDGDGNPFSLQAGAGCGNPWLTFTYKGQHYCLSAESIVQELITFANEAEEQK